MRDVWLDVRASGRSLARNRSFTLAAVLCVALGVGSTAILLSVLDALVLRPLPFASSERILWMSDVYDPPDEQRQAHPVSPRNFEIYLRDNEVFTELAAIQRRSFNLTGEGEAERVQGARVSQDFFDVFGVRPLRGRAILPAEDEHGGPNVVVLSHGFWSRRFDADPNLLGQSLTLDDEAYTVVGIMPPAFRFPQDTDLWVPLALHLPSNRFPDAHWLESVGLLQPGVSIDQGQDSMARLAQRLEQDRPDTNLHWSVELRPLQEEIIGDLDRALTVLGGAVTLLLLVACANFANLLLTRSIDQSEEIAVRCALGARRSQVVRRLLTESLMLALAGGLSGILLAYVALPLILHWTPVELPDFRDIRINPRILFMVLGISGLIGLVFGGIPAQRVVQGQWATLLKGGGRSKAADRSHSRWQGAFVVGQISLAILLLSGAGLLLATFQALHDVDPGFSRDQAVVARVALPRSNYPGDRERIRFVEETLRRLESAPTVETAGAVSTLPLRDRDYNLEARFSIEGRPPDTPGEFFAELYRVATPGYFESLGVPVLDGRAFAARDDVGGPPVALISKSMKRRYWPNESPLGRRIKAGLYDDDVPWLTIVGVVGDVKDEGLDREAPAIWYRPYAQDTDRNLSLIAHTASASELALPTLREAVRAVDPNLPIFRIGTIEDLLAESLARQRFAAFMLGLFAVLGLVLAAVGLYGLVSYGVEQRQRDIGIRMALGATSSRVLHLIARDGLRLTMIGVLLGLAATWGGTRFLAGFLYGVEPMDPWVLAVTCLVLIAVALLATYVPARRATRLDPILTLKTE